jgi:hypothetical protein
MKKALFLSLALMSAGPLCAQTFTTDVNITSAGTALPNVKVDGNGGVLFKGTFGAAGTIPATGAGTRVMWYPAKAAFLAGAVTGTQWNTIGNYSAAFGYTNQVPGDTGFAAGYTNNVGTGWSSAALGINNTIDESSASTVIGQSNYIHWGYNSFAAGGWNSLTNFTSIALGESNNSAGWTAVTIGRALTSSSAGCVVVGMANTPITGDADHWVGADPVFIVGNGANGTAASGTSPVPPATSNALVVYKNGTIKIPKRQGDIVMGAFGNGGSD